MMDECCAPQWTDLTSSPQVPSDDYFDKIHEVHEPQYFKQFKSQANSTTIANANETLKPEGEFETDLSIIKSTPVKIISPNSKNQNVIVIKETTYDDVLCEAMKNLELSVKKKKSRKSVMNQSSSNTLKTPTTRVLRSATRNSIKKALDESDVFKTPKAEHAQSIPQKAIHHESSIYKTPKGQEVQGTSLDHTNNEPGIYKARHPGDPEEIPQIMVTEESAACTASNTQPLKDSAQEIIDHESESCEESDAHGNENILQESHNKSDMYKAMTHETQHGSDKALEERDNENSEIAQVQDLQQNVEKEPEVSEDEKHVIPSNLVTSFKPRENSNSRKERRSMGGNQSKVLAGQYCQYRRRSIMKIQRRSGKYVSLAEAVTKYQNGTPKRFRSISSKESKHSTVAKLRRASLKLTVPISPALTSKTRTRPVTVLSHEQREELEIEEIKKHPIKANPLNLNALKGPQQLKKPEKKPITIPEPFHLTESYKMRANSTTNLQDSIRIHDSTTKSLHLADSGKTIKQQDTAAFKAPQILKKLNKMSESFNTSTFSRSRMTSTSSQDSIRCHDLPAKKLVPSVVSSDDKGIIVKNEEVLYFGIPNVQHSQKKSTHTVPFSFEMRNKEFQKKKEEKLKQLHDQESHKVKPEFRAKPVPNFCKSQAPPGKETVAKKSAALPCPFSFETRNNQLLKKKEELVKQVVMEEKKARVFHAKPAPEFKPVVVHGISRDNKPKEKSVDVPKKSGTIEGQLNKDQKNKHLSKTNRRTVGHVLHQEGHSDVTDGQNNHKKITADVEKNSAASENKQVTDQENRQPNIMSRRTICGNLKTEKSLNKNQPKKFSVPTLNTDKRMKQRQQFDEKVRQKEMEEEFKRQKAEEERLAKEKLEKALLRKQAESKARPMPVYKPMVLVKSTKPLTNPQSPAFTFKMKQRVLATRVENEV